MIGSFFVSGRKRMGSFCPFLWSHARCRRYVIARDRHAIPASVNRRCDRAVAETPGRPAEWKANTPTTPHLARHLLKKIWRKTFSLELNNPQRMERQEGSLPKFSRSRLLFPVGWVLTILPSGPRPDRVCFYDRFYYGFAFIWYGPCISREFAVILRTLVGYWLVKEMGWDFFF